MDAKQIKEQLSENDLLSILSDLGADPYIERNAIISRTICHNHNQLGSHKLYYYPESKQFRCYTECACNMDLFQLIEKVKGIGFKDAFDFIVNYFGFNISHEHIDYDEILDMSFFNKFNRANKTEDLKSIDDKILNIYYDYYHMSWIRDGIMPSTMKKFNIKMSIIDEQIIIPHYSKSGKLVGVRARNLNENLINKGKKYMPIFNRGIGYNHPTGANLYGLYENMDNIKEMKKVILFESEKSVLQLDTIYQGKGIGVAVSGSSFTDKQLELLQGLDIQEVIIAYDKEFNVIGDELERFYARKIKETIANKLIPYFSVSVIWDVGGLLNLKDSPTDKGTKTFTQLYKERITL